MRLRSEIAKELRLKKAEWRDAWSKLFKHIFIAADDYNYRFNAEYKRAQDQYLAIDKALKKLEKEYEQSSPRYRLGSQKRT